MYKALDSAAGEIRLLILEPAKTLGAPLVCRLEQVLLSTGPEYEAISYTWGTKGLGGTIAVDGEPAGLFENVEAVLRRLRLPKQPRTIWIDAVCIDQANVEERQAQVTLMRKIYEQARRVCIWLGESSEWSMLGMAFLGRQTDKHFSSGIRSLIESERLRSKQYHRMRHDLQMLMDGAGFLSMGSDSEEQNFGEIRELLDRPWWSRVWVVQEAVLAKELVLMCGPETTTWESIGKTIKHIYVGGSYTTGGIESFSLFGVPFGSTYRFPDESYKNISTLRDLWQTGDRDTSFFKMLFGFTSMGCTDPRDRIYSFLGFAPSDLRNSVEPDYSAPVPTVYEKFARQAMEVTKSLDILNCKREWLGLRDQGATAKPVYAYSMLDHGKYYDDFGPVIDKEGSKPRRDWARLPPGWERILTTNKCYYYNHNDKTTSQTSPLEGQPPQVAEHFTKRRVCPPGWIKTWDNLGRARVAYAPLKEARSRAEDPHKKELAAMPSWVPSWDTHTDFDPPWLISMLAADGRDHWFTTNHEADVITGQDATSPHVLSLEGMFFDEIEHIGKAWHPGDASPPISAGRMPVFAEWESLAETTPPDLKSPYAMYDLSTAEALARTLLMDPLGEWSAATPERLFQTWAEGTKWDTLQDPKFEAISMVDLFHTLLAFLLLESKMIKHYNSKMGCVDNAAVDSETLEAAKAAELNVVNKVDGLETSTADDTISLRSFILSMIKERFSKEEDDGPQREIFEKYGDMILRIHDCCCHRAFFVTKRGYFGLGPWNAQVGDRVYGLKGGKTPFLLRPAPSREADAFTLVGEAFVHDPLRGLPTHQGRKHTGWQSVRLI